MSERNGTVSRSDPGTMPIVLEPGATAASVSAPAPVATSDSTPDPDVATTVPPSPDAPAGATAAAKPSTVAEPAVAAEPAIAAQPDAATELAPGVQPTAPVTTRPRPRGPRRGPLTVMGPWAPVAGGLFGLLLGLVAVLLLVGVAGSFEDRLALAFLVLGLGMLGASGTLLADEVRMIRQRAREAAIRPQWVETTASLLNGLTPGRLLLGASTFVLFLAAFVSRG